MDGCADAMLPRLFEIPLGFTTLPVNTYGLMILAAFLAGLWIVSRRAPARGVAPELMTDLCVWLLLGGLVGSRIFYVLFYNRYDRVLMRYEYDFSLFDLTDGGLHPLGAVAGFLLVPAIAWWRSRRRPAPAASEVGASAPPPVASFPPRTWGGRLGLGGLALLGGLIAARVMYAVQHPARYSFKVFAIWEGGIVFYGGFLGALAVGLVYLVWRRAPVLVAIDLIAPTVALGSSIGRIGCFLKGCCFGAQADVPWAVSFPRIVETVTRDGRAALEVTGSPAFLHHRAACPQLVGPEATHSLPVHPTQLYESAAMLALFFLLSWYGSRRPRPGRVMAAMGAGYGLWRFGVEFLRGDWHPHAIGLTISQLVSLGAVAAAAVMWLVVPKEKPGAAATGPAPFAAVKT
jgi:phosphatidylglycerol:prolipoprotein diacylglycerol transferase